MGANINNFSFFAFLKSFSVIYIFLRNHCVDLTQISNAVQSKYDCVVT